MEAVSTILIVVGVVIIGVVLLLRWSMRRHSGVGAPTTSHPAEVEVSRVEHPEFDPLFAVDIKVTDVSDKAMEGLGKIIADQGVIPAHETIETQPESDGWQQNVETHLEDSGRRSPRVVEDPHRVVVLNVMAGMNRTFSGRAVRKALDKSGFEYGEWQIFHYYSPMNNKTPPMFSLANMIKPGSFDLEQMDTMSIAGLSLFMVPPGDEDDIVTFDTMLAKTRQLAELLGGEVRDARRSVLTRQAIGHIREQLNEWRCKSQIAQH
jgi:cell division protein ZipA